MTEALRFHQIDHKEYGWARYSPDERHRYLLGRAWSASPYDRRVLWIMLNPSTATEQVLDPTVRRCRIFSERWGATSMEVCNIFALRSTDPTALFEDSDPIGPDNDHEISAAADRAEQIIVAWGSFPMAADRGARVFDLIRSRGAHCVGVTKDGWPRHPLYVRGDQPPIAWQPPGWQTLSQ